MSRQVRRRETLRPSNAFKYMLSSQTFGKDGKMRKVSARQILGYVARALPSPVGKKDAQVSGCPRCVAGSVAHRRHRVEGRRHHVAVGNFEFAWAHEDAYREGCLLRLGEALPAR